MFVKFFERTKNVKINPQRFYKGGGAEFLKTKKRANHLLKNASLKSQKALLSFHRNKISQPPSNEDIRSLCVILHTLLEAQNQLIKFKQSCCLNMLVDDAICKIEYLVKETIDCFSRFGYKPLLCVDKYISHLKSQNLDFSDCR